MKLAKFKQLVILENYITKMLRRFCDILKILYTSKIRIYMYVTGTYFVQNTRATERLTMYMLLKATDIYYRYIHILLCIICIQWNL